MLKYEIWGIPRYVDGVPCDCKGYATRVECTEEECEDYGCGRDRPGRECCARAFECMICGKRHSAKAEAPDFG